MRTIFPFIILLALGSWIASCEAPNEEAKTGPEVVDIEEVLKDQYEQLSRKGTVIKTAKINDSTEIQEVQLSEEEWRKELQFFTNSDINRKSWVDYFTIDTQWLSKDDFKITYTTDREKVPVKRTEIIQDNEGETSYLFMLIKRSNPISGLNRKLIYAFPDSIIIHNEETLWLVGDQNVKISYRWPDSPK